MSLDITLTAKVPTEVFSANITHNLGKMAEEAGVYNALWSPESVDAFTAKDLIPFLRLGLQVLRSDPTRFKKFNPENGWGNYEDLVELVERYLSACVDYPEAVISVDR